MQTSVYLFRYVELPFEQLAAALLADPAAIIGDATAAAAAGPVATLSARLGPMNVSRDVLIDVGQPWPRSLFDLVLPVRWHATAAPSRFPTMRATIELLALAHEPPLTQVTLSGEYRPPLGVIGGAGDAIIGHRIAQACVDGFLDQVTERLARSVAA